MVLLAVVVEVVVEVVDVVEVLVVIQHRTVPISQDFPKVYSILSFGQSEGDKHLHWFSLSCALIIGSFSWATSLINSSSAVFKTSEKKMENQ